MPPKQPPKTPSPEPKGKSYKLLVQENFYTREAADNLLLGCPQLRALLEDGLLDLHGQHNVDYPFRTKEEVRETAAHAFQQNVPFFGFKYAIPPRSNGAAVAFQDEWACVYHGPSNLNNVDKITRVGLRIIPHP